MLYMLPPYFYFLFFRRTDTRHRVIVKCGHEILVCFSRRFPHWDGVDVYKVILEAMPCRDHLVATDNQLSATVLRVLCIHPNVNHRLQDITGLFRHGREDAMLSATVTLFEFFLSSVRDENDTTSEFLNHRDLFLELILDLVPRETPVLFRRMVNPKLFAYIFIALFIAEVNRIDDDSFESRFKIGRQSNIPCKLFPREHFSTVDGKSLPSWLEE